MLKDIRHFSSEEQAKVYEEIDRLYHQGLEVRLTEHKSGFPAVTVRCAKSHYLTDVLSLEEWWAGHKAKHHHGPPTEGGNHAQGTNEPAVSGTGAEVPREEG